MLVCDHCLTKCCHIFCLSPPLDHIPYEPWYCDFCIREHNLRTTLPQANFFGPRRRRRAPVLDDEDEESMPILSRHTAQSISTRNQPVSPNEEDSGIAPRRGGGRRNRIILDDESSEERFPPNPARGRRTDPQNSRNRAPAPRNRLTAARNNSRQQMIDEDDVWLAEASNSRDIRSNLNRNQSQHSEGSSEGVGTRQGPVYQRNPDFINSTDALHEFREQRRQSRLARTQPTQQRATSNSNSNSGLTPSLTTLPLERFPASLTARTFSRANQLKFEEDAFDDEFS